MGRRLPGYHVEQACATGLQAVLLGGAEVQMGGKDAVGVLTFDRTSDSPAGVFPERRAHQRTQTIADVWDNFGFDPSTELRVRRLPRNRCCRWPTWPGDRLRIARAVLPLGRR